MHYHDKGLATSLTKHRGTREPKAQTEERTLFHLQIHFTQFLQAQRKAKVKDQYDLSIRQQRLEFTVIFHCPPVRPTLMIAVIIHQLQL